MLLVAMGAVQPRAAAGVAIDPTGPGQVQLLANCLDLCTVTVSLSGNGSGSWQSTNSGYVPDNKINCAWLNGIQAPGSDCSEVYGGVDRVTPVRVYYRATPSTGSQGCVEGTCASAPILYFADLLSKNVPVFTTLSATFNLRSYLVTVNRTGTGNGSITSSPSGIVCGSFCESLYFYGSLVTLTASATSGSYFAGWTGACANTVTTVCQLTVGGPTNTSAIFGLGSPPTASPAAPTPTATARATVKPTGTPRAGTAPTNGPSLTAASQPPDATAPGSAGPETAPATLGAGASSSPQAATEPPDVPAGTIGTDLTPIALAILGAGLLVAIGIGFAAVLLRRRSPPAA